MIVFRKVLNLTTLWPLLVFYSRALAEDHYPPDATAAYLLRLRGFIADEFYVNTTSGYILRLTRGRNPLIKNGYLPWKVPVLFVHGLGSDSNNFVLYSHGAKPKDLTSLKIESMSLDELKVELKHEPSANSLALLASNCGHEVWLLSRRGSEGSQQLWGDSDSIQATPSNQSGRAKSPMESLQKEFSRLVRPAEFTKRLAFTMDEKFWKYSLDEQAEDDLPQTIRFILKTSPWASRVSIVGHSAGGAITLMSLTLMSDQMRDQVASVILWAPAYAFSKDSAIRRAIYKSLAPSLSAYKGPLVVPPLVDGVLQAILMAFCKLPGMSGTVCNGALDSLFGPSGGQQPATVEFLAAFPHACASHEVIQLAQCIFNAPNYTIRKYDHGPEQNLVLYNQTTPPAYNLGVLPESFSRISFYAALTDDLIKPIDVERTRAQLKAPSRFHLINTNFNHVGFFAHNKARELAIVPSMHELVTLL